MKRTLMGKVGPGVSYFEGTSRRWLWLSLTPQALDRHVDSFQTTASSQGTLSSSIMPFYSTFHDNLEKLRSRIKDGKGTPYPQCIMLLSICRELSQYLDIQRLKDSDGDVNGALSTIKPLLK